MLGTFKGRRIRRSRLVAQVGAAIFLIGIAYGIPSFGSSPLLRYFFLPNASCRYINTAPTYCYFYSLQDGLTTGYAAFFIDSLLILLIVTILILILGRLWCSWLCPFGLVQELLNDLRNALRLPPLRLKWSHKVLLQQVKYALLFFTILISVSIGIAALGLTGYQSALALPFCQVCPAKGFFTVLQQLIGAEPLSTRLPALAIGMLVFFFASSFLIRMFWCRVCPMGGYMALFGTRSQVWLYKDAGKCTRCRICLRVCPMDHDRVYEEMESIDVAGGDCTLCCKCVEMCPEEDCLALAIGPRRLVGSKKPQLKARFKA